MYMVDETIDITISYTIPPLSQARLSLLLFSGRECRYYVGKIDFHVCMDM